MKKSSKKFGPGRSRRLKQQRLNRPEPGSAEAYQLQREYAADIDVQFDHFMRTRHGAEWQTALDPGVTAMEYAEFRRRRNKWIRRHRHFDGPPAFRPPSDFSAGAKPEGHFLPPLTPTSEEEPPTE